MRSWQSLLIVGLTFVLTSCGFALRGYHNQQIQMLTTAPVVVVANATVQTERLKKQLQQRLKQLYKAQPLANVANSVDTHAVNQAQLTRYAIELNQVNLTRYELLGIVTEIKMVLSADVTYQFVIPMGQPHTVTKQLQVQRSYQYNKATVNADNPQEQIVEKWLYEALAAQIDEQYLVLAQQYLANP